MEISKPMEHTQSSRIELNRIESNCFVFLSECGNWFCCFGCALTNSITIGIKPNDKVCEPSAKVITKKYETKQACRQARAEKHALHEI